MGRELKRVPLGFDWPLNKTWEGYVNPHYKECPGKDVTCLNGYTPGRAWLGSIVQLLMCAAGDAAYAASGIREPGRRTFPHPYLAECATAPHTEGEWDRERRMWRRLPKIVPPSADLMDLTEGLAGRRASGGFGHDSCDTWSAENKIIEAAGLPEDWGICPICKGDNLDPEVREAYEAWEDEEPPTGEGYQLWQNTSEGSPVSPVFESLDELCAWCEGNATTFGSFKASAEQWKEMLNDEFVAHREGNLMFF